MVRGTTRLLVPECLQSKFIALAHDPHQGIVRKTRTERALQVAWHGQTSVSGNSV